MHKLLILLVFSCFLTACATTSNVAVSESSTESAQTETQESGDNGSMLIPENALRTESGYAYVVLKPGNGQKPAMTDAVQVHLRVLNVEGAVVDEESATVAYSHSTPFVTEMLSLMEIGEQVRAWGESQARIWEIELMGIDETYRAPEDAAAAPEDAFHLPDYDDVRWRLIEPGKGEIAHTGQALRVQASRWKSNGEILESNRASRGQIVFLNDESQQLDPLHNAMLRQMNEGAHVRMWIPAVLIGTDYDLVEDMWLAEYLTQLDVPNELTVPDDKNVIAILPDGAWIRFDTQGNAEKLVENDAVQVDMTCWNAANGVLIDSSILRGAHDVMEIKPALGIWFDIMKQAAPGAEFMAWIKASAMPEQVNMDLTCRVQVFDKLVE